MLWRDAATASPVGMARLPVGETVVYQDGKIECACWLCRFNAGSWRVFGVTHLQRTDWEPVPAVEP